MRQLATLHQCFPGSAMPGEEEEGRERRGRGRGREEGGGVRRMRGKEWEIREEED